MRDSIYIYKDDQFTIVLAKNHWKGVVVQLGRFAPRQVTGPGNQMIEERYPYSVWSKEVSSTKMFDGKSNEMVPKDPTAYRKEVSDAIVEAKQMMAKFQNLESVSDGILNDYLSSSRQYNPEPASQ